MLKHVTSNNVNKKSKLWRIELSFGNKTPADDEWEFLQAGENIQEKAKSGLTAS